MTGGHPDEGVNSPEEVLHGKGSRWSFDKEKREGVRVRRFFSLKIIAESRKGSPYLQQESRMTLQRMRPKHDLSGHANR